MCPPESRRVHISVGGLQNVGGSGRRLRGFGTVDKWPKLTESGNCFIFSDCRFVKANVGRSVKVSVRGVVVDPGAGHRVSLWKNRDGQNPVDQALSAHEAPR